MLCVNLEGKNPLQIYVYFLFFFNQDDPLKENVFLTSNSLTEKEVEFVKESLTKPLVKLESSTDILDGNPEKKELKKEPMIELVNTDECPVGGRF